ncbi:hypothetical protein CH362_18920 [Leptospira saintgironsiae]|uniref:Uncharacterized protein n=1 Tax=Leptospira saintgironsiae TaxID=2023183 RepID=A0A2M9Y7D8_9LEPT|nr:hypothetical protein CH362_18920 [Leptospira saintgironsiae]
MQVVLIDSEYSAKHFSLRYKARKGRKAVEPKIDLDSALSSKVKFKTYIIKNKRKSRYCA